MNPLEKLLRKLNPYRGVRISLHFWDGDLDVWNQFLADFNPKIKVLGTKKTDRISFNSGDIKVGGIEISFYGPYYSNPNFDSEAYDKLMDKTMTTKLNLDTKQLSMIAWCDECQGRKKVTELYLDKMTVVATLDCHHDFRVMEKEIDSLERRKTQ